jgi:hypothetical protein
MYAAAMAYAPAAMAAQGFDVPAGVNPVTQLHQKEMVLPAEHAETIRSMAGGGAGRGTTVNIQAVDAQSIAKLFKRNGPAMMKAARSHFRSQVHR